MRTRPALGVLVLLLCLLAAAPGSAVAQAGSQHRFAVVIGTNQGAPDEVGLAYAERDAARMAAALTQLGDVRPERLVLLQGASAGAVRRVLEDLKRRVAEVADEPGGSTVLFVYYSGHADAAALHLGQTELLFRTLKRLVDEVAADVSIFVVDACQSGGLTRVKGAVPAQPFEIRAPP